MLFRSLDDLVMDAGASASPVRIHCRYHVADHEIGVGIDLLPKAINSQHWKGKIRSNTLSVLSSLRFFNGFLSEAVLTDIQFEGERIALFVNRRDRQEIWWMDRHLQLLAKDYVDEDLIMVREAYELDVIEGKYIVTKVDRERTYPGQVGYQEQDYLEIVYETFEGVVLPQQLVLMDAYADEDRPAVQEVYLNQPKIK